MSILSRDAQRSTSSSPESPSLNPTSANHGFLLQPSCSHSSSASASHPPIPAFGSLQIFDSDSESSLALPNQVSGSLASAAAESVESSQKVSDVGTPNGKKNLPHHIGKQSLCYTADQELGAARGKWAASSISLPGQENSGSISAHGSVPQASGRKSQMTNGNYLLNFRYDPISRSQPRAPPPPRRQHKIKPYNKDLFLQANYRFVVLDSGIHTPELMDPDKMLQWEDIICVKYSTPHPVQCPICLDYPICPQITSCGHIFCFPCILRYLFMGQEDEKGDCWKKCPLCFMMVCSKDLYTIHIEDVKSYCVGDTVEFILLTRQKDSNIPSQRFKQESEAKGSCNDDVYDLFSKFTFTSDVDMSVRKAISDLDSWLVRADSGLVDDLEKLPYVSAAMEQLEQRKKYWNEHKKDSSNKADKHIDCPSGSYVHSSMAYANHASNKVCGTPPTVEKQNKCPGDVAAKNLDDLFQNSDMGDSLVDQNGVLSSSYDEKISLRRHTNSSRDIREKDLYNFYQAVDGQHLILHPLNMKCFLHHYGSYDMLPHRINGKVLQLETVTQSEAIRRRFRYLSHFSLTTTFQLCEIDLSEILPSDSLSPFMDEIKKREKQRKRLARKEQMEKTRAEVAIADSVFIPFNSGESYYQNPPEFSMDDFEALGSPALTSSSPPTLGERRLFSSVTKLGFAAGHDSPALNIDAAHSLHNFEVASNSSGGKKDQSDSSSSATGLRIAGMQSFANVTSREKSVEPKMNETGKKGKKPTRVLLSTAGGRRY